MPPSRMARVVSLVGRPICFLVLLVPVVIAASSGREPTSEWRAGQSPQKVDPPRSKSGPKFDYKSALKYLESELDQPDEKHWPKAVEAAQRYGILLTRDFAFHVEAQVEPLEGGVAPSLTVAIDAALSKHPKELLHSVLERIVVCRRIIDVDSSTRQCMALPDEKAILLACNRPWRHAWPIDSDKIISAIHHDIALLLMARYAAQFDQDAWLDATPPGFRYGKHNNRTAFYRTFFEDRAPSTTRLEADWGFLSDESVVRIDEDAATIGEWLFATPERLFDVAAMHPAIRWKVELWSKFCGRLDPELGKLASLPILVEQDRYGLRAIRKQLGSQDAKERTIGIERLARIADFTDPYCPELESAARDRDRAIRWKAASVVCAMSGRRGDALVTPLLIEFLSDRDSHARFQPR